MTGSTSRHGCRSLATAPLEAVVLRGARGYGTLTVSGQPRSQAQGEASGDRV